MLTKAYNNLSRRQLFYIKKLWHQDAGSLEINRTQLLVQYFSCATEKPLVSKGALNFVTWKRESCTFGPLEERGGSSMVPVRMVR